ncbi:unnamed protein product, partial [Laminaria digitata]
MLLSKQEPLVLQRPCYSSCRRAWRCFHVGLFSIVRNRLAFGALQFARINAGGPFCTTCLAQGRRSTRTPKRVETQQKRSDVARNTSGMSQSSSLPCLPPPVPVDKEGLTQ